MSIAPKSDGRGRMRELPADAKHSNLSRSLTQGAKARAYYKDAYYSF